jgi:hypothetical protein
MSNDTMDLYLIQDPADYPKSKDDGNYTGYLQDLLNAHKNSISVHDVRDFVQKVMTQYMIRCRRIKKMVIGAHGAGGASGFGGMFRIGKSWVTRDTKVELNTLRVLAPLFARDADVYIVACHTGYDQVVLNSV